MDWHGILSTTFLICFWVGLVLTVVMSVMSGAFHTEFGSGSAFEGGHVTDLGGADIEAGHFDAAHANVGWVDGQVPGASPLSPGCGRARIAAISSYTSRNVLCRIGSAPL